MASTWLPTLSVLGADGLPPTSKASGLVRNSTSLKLSFRIPPGVDGKKALQDTIKLLTHNVPYNATVEISNTAVNTGALDPESNAHAPDESLDLLYAEALTVWTANLVVATPQE